MNFKQLPQPFFLAVNHNSGESPAHNRLLCADAKYRRGFAKIESSFLPPPTALPEKSHLTLARASLQQTLSWHRRRGNSDARLQAAIAPELQEVRAALEKLESCVVRIAAFGLVGRGKSAVINATLGRNAMPVGPLHGVTRYPQTVRWVAPSGKAQLELIDTPGLDEIDGEERAQLARETAARADLILFVVAGDITRLEYEALCELRQAHKPLLLVFNKIDLYPDCDRASIYRQLQALGSGSSGRRLQKLLSPEEIALVAAAPAPVRVRVERADGSTSEEWETPPPQIANLRRKIHQILNREGRTLLALNALSQAQAAQERLAATTIAAREARAEEIIWQHAKYKAIAVAVNPIGVLDVLGGAIADLLLIRALARLYGLPMTNFEASKLWQKILVSSGSLLVGELGTSLLFGLGKSAMMLESPGLLPSLAGAAIVQGGIAGYGTYAVGQATKGYLERGCSWGPLGPSTVMREILERLDADTIAYRLRQDLSRSL